MKLDDLLRHEKGILNVLDTSIQNKGTVKEWLNYAIAKRPNWNHSISQIKGPKLDQKQNPIFSVKLSVDEYDSVFKQNPSFYEKQAFVELFRKKWKEDNGYCSKFQKRGAYKEAADMFKQKQWDQERKLIEKRRKRKSKTRPHTSLIPKRHERADSKDLTNSSYKVNHKLGVNFKVDNSSFYKSAANRENPLKMVGESKLISDPSVKEEKFQSLSFDDRNSRNGQFNSNNPSNVQKYIKETPAFAYKGDGSNSNVNMFDHQSKKRTDSAASYDKRIKNSYSEHTLNEDILEVDLYGNDNEEDKTNVLRNEAIEQSFEPDKPIVSPLLTNLNLECRS